MKQILFSIIVPCYNSWSLMERGLQSLEGQTFRDFEVLFIDDCSTDDTYVHLLHYQKISNLSIRLLKNEENCGPGKSRNQGIRQARGEYIAFLDSDDWYHVDFLEEMYKKIFQEKAEIVLCDFYRHLANGKSEWIQCSRPYLNITNKCQFVALCFDSLWVAVIKRELFGKVNLPPLYHAEDSVTISLLTAHAQSISFLNKPLYNYLCRKNSLSTTKELGVIEEVCEAFLYLSNCLPAEFEKEIEFRGIRMILYGVVFKALQAGVPLKDFGFRVDEFKHKNKYWYKNEYLTTLPWRKRLFLCCVRFKMYFWLRFYVRLQTYLLKV